MLLAFLQQEGTFDLLTANQLFMTNLRSGVPGPQGLDAGWTFAGLVRDFGQPQGFGDQDQATRSALSQRMDAIVYAQPATPTAPLQAAR